ncbi:MAG: alpha/beta hydrolase [Cyclobacteriaceae bacterium]|nr:alpha/beta hydrolase [Cyclobacteriaceae bacterium]MCH8517552.1 alpha/beta hydrolase [Cyclobacteriaceae bacterium]
MKNHYFLISCLIMISYSQFALAQHKSADYTFAVEGGELKGTLTLPEDKAPYPVVLLISGSGPTDRDGNNPFMKNNSLKMLAEGLAEEGIASLRYDKRGIATGEALVKNEQDLRFNHYVDDASAAIKSLKEDKRFSSITVIGHSEGALIAKLSTGGDRIVSLAGAGRPVDLVLIEQLTKQAPNFVADASKVLDSLKMGFTVKNVNPMLQSLFRPSVQPYMISWLKHDPAAIIAELDKPVLIVQGESDIQVKAEDAQALRSAAPDAKFVSIAEMNHVLKKIGMDNIQENYSTYSKPELPLHPELIPYLVDFIKN